MLGSKKIVCCPKEIKNLEGRVALTPSGAAELISSGHSVFIESGAGEKSGFLDESYQEVGCIIATQEEVWKKAHIIVKVKEPCPSEYVFLRPNLVIFAYFHFAANKELAEVCMKSGAIFIAYETVETSDRRLPLLQPMSEIAGRMSIQCVMNTLVLHNGGMGVLLSGVPGTTRSRILIIGGGVVGYNAAKMAAGLGVNVVIMDKNIDRLRYLDEILPPNVTTRYASETAIKEELPLVDAVVGAVLLPGSACPKLIKREDLKLMKKGSVIIDVAIDHGGCVETMKATTHQDPTFVVDGVIHYGVSNMPGTVPCTSTQALSNATISYLLQLANKGWVKACYENSALMNGLNIISGKCVYKGVAESLKIQYTPLNDIFDQFVKKELGIAVNANSEEKIVITA